MAGTKKCLFKNEHFHYISESNSYVSRVYNDIFDGKYRHLFDARNTQKVRASPV